MSNGGRLSPSGVWIADDFRSNLIIDRYDPLFADMRASKLKHLRSANSEDAVTWNVFRSMRQIDPACWFPTLWSSAFPQLIVPNSNRATVNLWVSVDPPLGLLEEGDEGTSEIDVVIEAPSWVWFIEAKHRSDISTGTTTRPERDQVLRNLDVGTHYAGVRDFYFSLLISDPSRSPLGVDRVKTYSDLTVVQEKLNKHRPDQLRNLRAISVLNWTHTRRALESVTTNAPRDDERAYAQRALQWMTERAF